MATEQAGIRRRALLAGTAAGVDASAVAVPLVRERSAQAATASRRAVYSLNPDWRLVQQDVAGAPAPSFNDSAWVAVSVPHTYKDVDSFDNYITGSGIRALDQQSGAAGRCREPRLEFHTGHAGYPRNLHWRTERVELPAVLKPIDETSFASTNASSQYGLAAIQCLTLVGHHLP
ncbi:hypothetical protein [Allorhizocola rhizosphaerae]|uniref:exo-rhamnogalacturonan lyase family protein n=1 Tax=Allorhizocola rhizosphaerae TaxID=1872709 RepID=UPI0013C368AE|nr:hypothetical protein [Allorhizocola rhizosphaerae]